MLVFFPLFFNLIFSLKSLKNYQFDNGLLIFSFAFFFYLDPTLQHFKYQWPLESNTMKRSNDAQQQDDNKKPRYSTGNHK